MNNEQWMNRIIHERIAVSDTMQFTSANAPVACIDPDRGRIYTVYSASRYKYGEQSELLAIAVIPVAQPQFTKTVVLLEQGVQQNGKVFNTLVDAAAVFLHGKVRVTFLANSDEYYFVDYDPTNDSVSMIQPIKCRFDGSGGVEPLTTNAIIRYLDSKGMTGYNLFIEPYEHLINTATPAYHDWTFYGCLTSAWMQPIVWRCMDGQTYEFLGVIPKLCKYECTIAFENDDLYALLRGADGCNYYVSHDMGHSFEETPLRVPVADVRPRLINYEGKLLMAYSEIGVQPNRMRDGRNNVRILLGNGGDYSKYKEIMYFIDALGVVYYEIVNYKGILYMIWSSSELYPEKTLNGLVHGKDLLWYFRIGDFRDFLN